MTFERICLLFAGLQVGVACGRSEGDTAGVTAVCEPVYGSGKVIADASGLPPAAIGSIWMNSPIDGHSFAMMTNETPAVPTGEYVACASPVSLPDPVVRTLYHRVPLCTPICVEAGKTTRLTLRYAPVATSGKLWFGSTGTDGRLLGYSPGSIGASGVAVANVAAGTSDPGAFTFDTDGNLWIIGATSTGPSVARYPASGLIASGPKTPDIILHSPSFYTGPRGPRALAFDGQQNLWVSLGSANKVVAFTPEQQRSSGNPAATVEFTGIEEPSGIAFDRNGNMYIASTASGKVVRLKVSRQATSGAGTDLDLVVQSPPPVVVALAAPEGLAFDSTGSLWVSFDDTLARLSPSDLAGSGTKTITPAVQIRAPATARPHGIAVDESGGLWFALDRGQFGRLSPAQLAASGQPQPEVVIDAPDLGTAGWIALFPPPI